MAENKPAAKQQSDSPSKSGGKHSAEATAKTAKSTGTTDQFELEDAQEKGYYGRLPHNIPDEEYSLETGPDSPTGNLHVAPVVLFDPENEEHTRQTKTVGKEA